MFVFNIFISLYIVRYSLKYINLQMYKDISGLKDIYHTNKRNRATISHTKIIKNKPYKNNN